MDNGPQMVTLDELARDIDALALGSGRRWIVGLAGPPAAGKSTLAARLCSVLNAEHEDKAIAVSMDGFHLSNAELKSQGELARKGQPQTFDVGGFVARLRAVRETEPGISVPWPVYDRSIHEPVPDGVTIRDESIVVVDGNYLLLDSPGWADVRTFLDTVWYLDSDRRVLEPRLLARHMAGGLALEDARRKITESDMVNMDVVARTAFQSDLIIRVIGDRYKVSAPETKT